MVSQNIFRLSGEPLVILHLRFLFECHVSNHIFLPLFVLPLLGLSEDVYQEHCVLESILLLHDWAWGIHQDLEMYKRYLSRVQIRTLIPFMWRLLLYGVQSLFSTPVSTCSQRSLPSHTSPETYTDLPVRLLENLPTQGQYHV